MVRATTLLLLAALLASPFGFAKGGGSSGGGGHASFGSGFSSGRGAVSSASSSHAAPSAPTQTAVGTFGAGNTAPVKPASALSGDLAASHQQATALKTWDASQKTQPKPVPAPTASPVATPSPASAPVPSAPAPVVVHQDSGGSNPMLWFMLGESLGRGSHAPVPAVTGSSTTIPASAKPEQATDTPSMSWLWTALGLFVPAAVVFGWFLYLFSGTRQTAKSPGRKAPNYSLD